MKITVGKLRRLIREAAQVQVEPGMYYMLADVQWKTPGVVQVIKVGPDPRMPELDLVQYRERADSISSQVMSSFMNRVQREATPEEIEQAEAKWHGDEEHMARTIDTSREGT